jgi:hypothetical protein
VKRRGSTLVRDLVVVLAGTVLAVMAGAVAWGAVARLGGGLGEGRPLQQGEVLRALEHARALPTHHQTASPNVSGPTRTRSWQVPGGTVAAACRGRTVELLYASPSDGWTYRSETGGPGVLAIEFSRQGAVTHLVARCVGGTPSRVLRSSAPAQTGGGGGGGEETGD